MPGALGGVAGLCVTFAQNKLLCVVVSPTQGAWSRTRREGGSAQQQAAASSSEPSKHAHAMPGTGRKAHASCFDHHGHCHCDIGT